MRIPWIILYRNEIKDKKQRNFLDELILFNSTRMDLNVLGRYYYNKIVIMTNNIIILVV